MEGIGFIALAIAAVLVGFFVVRQSKTKGRWGIGSLNPACPRCGTSMPAIRRPASIAEAMWGRMDVPEMRLQGRQVWARADCTLRRHALLAYGRRVADADDA